MIIQKISRVIINNCKAVLLRKSATYFSPARCLSGGANFSTYMFDLNSLGVKLMCKQFMRPGMLNVYCQRFYAKGAIIKQRKGKGLKPKVQLSEDEMNEVVVVDDIRSEMQQVINSVKESYIKHLSVRLTSGSIDNLPVIINGENFPLNQLAQISKKNPHLVAINMTGFPEGLKPAIKALQDSGMGLNPQQDGTMIYVPLPKMTKEHRENLAKNAKMLLQKGKDELRDIQNKYIKEVKKHKDDFSEDLIFNVQEHIKVMTETYAAEGEKLMIAKQKELLGES